MSRASAAVQRAKRPYGTALAPDCARLLAQDGLCALEIGCGQGDAIAALLAAHGLIVVERWRNLAGIERGVLARHHASGGRDP
jgi:methylase of polypeptide subunit release factors